MRQSSSRPGRTEATPVVWSLLEESTIVAAVLVSEDGRILGANSRMRALLGIRQLADLAGCKLSDYLVQPDEWPSSSSSSAGVIVRMRSANGETVTLRGDIRRTRTGGAPATCGLFVDGGEALQLRAAVQHSARMEALGSLTAGIAHDFNNLLTVLVGNLYLVTEELRDRPKAFERVKSAREASKRGADLIKQLLAFARREQLETDDIDPCNVVSDVEPLLRRALGIRIELRAELDAECGRVRASTAQLESVIVNLAINARDAIEGKGRVTIRVRQTNVAAAEAARLSIAKPGDYVVVSVIDDGGGIPPEAIGRVFEPFFSTKRERGGTGLGLSMVRWFVEQSGGVIKLDSTVGKGTTVALYLPRSADPTFEVSDKTMPLSTLPTGTERVLVLSPDDAVRSTMRQILEVLGYSVELTATDDEMIAAVGARRPELLIVDGPARDDTGLIDRVRASGSAPKVIVTVEGQRSQARSVAAPLGFTALVKPFTLADLASTVRRTLDTKGDRPSSD